MISAPSHNIVHTIDSLLILNQLSCQTVFFYIGSHAGKHHKQSAAASAAARNYNGNQIFSITALLSTVKVQYSEDRQYFSIHSVDPTDPRGIRQRLFSGEV